MLITISWTDILETTKSLWTMKIRRRRLSPSLFARSPIVACLLGYAMDPLLFMDDFSVYGSSFEECLHHLTLVLVQCKEKNLVLNWEKCHLMVKQGIVLGHVISHRGIEVDKAKIDLISNLPPPRTLKDSSRISAKSPGPYANCW